MLRPFAAGCALGVLAAVTAAVWPAAAVATRDRCAPRADTLVRTSAVIVWRAPLGPGTQLYSCVPATGRVHRVVHGGGPVYGLAEAGHFLAFIYGGPAFTYVAIFDAASGHTELTLSLGCGDASSGCRDPYSAFQLAPNGWVAEVAAEGNTLLATDGRVTTVAFDEGPAMTLLHARFAMDPTTELGIGEATGETVTWSPAGGAKYSLALGPKLAAFDAHALETSSVPAPADPPTPCSLFDEQETAAILGAVTQAAAPESCAYSTASGPSGAESAYPVTLSVTLEAGLSPVQVQAAERQAVAAESGAGSLESEITPPGPQRLWTASWAGPGEGMFDSEVVDILGNLKLTAICTTLDSGDEEFGAVDIGPGLWNDVEAVHHVADIVLDRLTGLPIS